jgi:apolipoprotein N-acyltransferase
MRQAADLAGAHGLSFVVILVNECLGAMVARERWRAGALAVLAPAACAALLLAALAGYGTVRYRQLASDGAAGTPVTAGLVQAGIANYERLRAEQGTFNAVRTILDAHVALSQQAFDRARLGGRAELDLLLWPETVYPTTFGSPKSPEGATFDRAIGAFVVRAGVPLVFGAYDAEGSDEFNAAVFLEPGADGGLSFDAYRKARLFPLTEHVPRLLESHRLRAWLPWLGRWRAGVGGQGMALGLPGGRSLRIAPLICLDAVDPRLALEAVRRGAEIIVTLSNDSWFAVGNGPRLHLVVSAFRSLETRRPQLRVTNTGISAVIAPTGELIATAEVFDRTSLVTTVTPVGERDTLMLAWGDWFGPTAFALALLALALVLVRRRAT